MFDPAVWEPIWKETERQDRQWREWHSKRLEDQAKELHRVWLLGIGDTNEHDIVTYEEDYYGYASAPEGVWDEHS